MGFLDLGCCQLDIELSSKLFSGGVVPLGTYSGFMGFYSGLMGFYSGSMGVIGMFPSGKLT